jgi:hypothetical protein
MFSWQSMIARCEGELIFFAEVVLTVDMLAVEYINE